MTPRVWDIIGRRRIGYALSILIVVPAVLAIVYNMYTGQGALNWGVDFTGGNYFHLKLERPFTIADVRPVVDRVATGQSVIQKTEQEVFIRTRPLTPENKQALLDGVKQRFGAMTVLREDEVGPKIGQELRIVAVIAVLVGLLLQVIYISFRFKSIRYALTADVALLHDIIVVLGIFALTRKEVNSSFVAVLLTVVGYSINDTIVVFDRIRENLTMRTREAFDRLVNRSMLEAMVRSINTALTTILAIGAVYFFGGSTIRDFAFGLMLGIAVGTYSSVFNASAILVDWQLWADRRSGRVRPGEPAAAAAPSTAPAGSGGAAGARDGGGRTAQQRGRRSRRR